MASAARPGATRPRTAGRDCGATARGTKPFLGRKSGLQDCDAPGTQEWLVRSESKGKFWRGVWDDFRNYLISAA